MDSSLSMAHKVMAKNFVGPENLFEHNTTDPTLPRTIFSVDRVPATYLVASFVLVFFVQNHNIGLCYIFKS